MSILDQMIDLVRDGKVDLYGVMYDAKTLFPEMSARERAKLQMAVFKAFEDGESETSQQMYDR